VNVTRLAALVLVTLALAGCGGKSDEESASTTPAATNEMTQTTEGCQPLSGAAVTPQKSSANGSRETMYLTGVSVDTDVAGCEAVVRFEFEKQAPGPGYEASYQPASTAKIQDGSGNTIEIDGNAFLVVKLTPAMTAKIEGDEVTKTYKGPNRVASDAPSFVKEIVKTGDFENTVTWVIGLDRERPFKTTAGDAGLMIDIDGS
jgi:hypothetical protein